MLDGIYRLCYVGHSKIKAKDIKLKVSIVKFDRETYSILEEYKR